MALYQPESDVINTSCRFGFPNTTPKLTTESFIEKVIYHRFVQNTYIQLFILLDVFIAHATSTPAGDLSELKAIKKLFGAHPNASISATKSMKGLYLGQRVP